MTAEPVITSHFSDNGKDQVSETVRELHFVVPGKNVPGYAKRTKRALELRKQLLTDPEPELVDRLVEFLADYVRADSREQALELIWDATEAQWEEMLDALGGTQKAAVPPPILGNLPNS